MHCSTPLSHRSACRCQECKVVEPEGGRGTAQLSDVASSEGEKGEIGQLCNSHM